MPKRRDPPFTFQVSSAAGSDLEEIKARDLPTHARIALLLFELKSDQNQLQNLLNDRYGQAAGERYTHTYGIQFIGEFRRHNPKRDIWRLKIWDLENNGVQFRLVYMYIPKCRMFVVLAIAPRHWNYEFSNPLSSRITADYDRLLAKYG